MAGNALLPIPNGIFTWKKDKGITKTFLYVFILIYYVSLAN